MASGTVVLLKQLRDPDPERRRRFAEEARLAAEVDHPNVVRVLRASGDALVAEWVEGADLGAVLRDGPLPPPLAAFVAREAARGLAAIHDAGILHRDVSPGNLLLGADGSVKLTDFGLASIEGDAGSEVRGTLSTLAPEVVRGEAPSVRGDLFSLGAVLAHAVTGRALFEGSDSSATLDAVLHHDPSASLAADPRLPDLLVEVALGLLAKDPAARPARASEVVVRLTALVVSLGDPGPDDLAAYLANPSAYRPPPVILPAPTPAADRPPVPREPVRSNARHRQMWRWGPLAAVALAAVALGIGLSRGPETEGTKPNTAEPLATAPLDIVARPEAPDADSAQPGDPVGLPPSDPVAPRSDPPRPAPRPGIPPSPDITPAPPRGETPDGSRPSRGPAPRPEPQPAPGTLDVRVEPWARVRVADRDLGISPVEAATIPAGPTVVTLTNPDFPTQTIRVDVAPGENVETVVSLWDFVAQITFEISPWAEVAVNGTVWDTVPPQTRPLILTPGDHVLRFAHPTLGTREIPLRVAAGDRRTVRVRMDRE